MWLSRCRSGQPRSGHQTAEDAAGTQRKTSLDRSLRSCGVLSGFIICTNVTWSGLELETLKEKISTLADPREEYANRLAARRAALNYEQQRSRFAYSSRGSAKVEI